MDILTAVAGAVGAAGAIGTFYFGYRMTKLAREKQRFSWGDVAEGCRSMSRKAIRRFKPNVVLCVAGPSSIVANLMVEFSNHFVPQYVVCLEKHLDRGSLPFDLAGYRVITTTKWRLHFPEVVLADPSVRVLVIDDSVISGDSMWSIREALLAAGFEDDHIMTCSLVCTNVAKMTNKAPDQYYYLIENSNFYLPWGKGY